MTLTLDEALAAIYWSHPWLAAAGTTAYLGLCGLCLATWRKACRQAHGWWWCLLAGFQLFLAADALFGIRLIIAEMGREFFQEHGWYAARWPFQAALSAAVLIAMGVLLGVTLRFGRSFPPGCRLAVGGALLSLLPFLIACISMHVFEDLLAWPIWPLGLGTIARAGGCVMTGVGGWRSFRNTPKNT